MAGRCSMAVVALIMMLAQSGMGEVPGTMSYQGVLTDSDGGESIMIWSYSPMVYAVK